VPVCLFLQTAIVAHARKHLHMASVSHAEWLNNPQTGRFAKEYLLKLSQDCVDKRDAKIVEIILLLKVKPVHLQSYHEAFNRLLMNNKEVSRIVSLCE
jgi:hypothetical protein